MNTLLGFIVLSGPLFIVIPLVLIGVAIAVLVGKYVIKKGKVLKLVVGVLVCSVVVFLPFSGEILGKMYLSHLCETETETKIYNTVELPMEYWNKFGKPRFLYSSGVLNNKILGGRFTWRSQKTPYISNFIKINKIKYTLYDNKSNTELAERYDFERYYGWVKKFSPAPNIGEGCGVFWQFERKERSIKNYNLMLEIFTKSAK